MPDNTDMDQRPEQLIPLVSSVTSATLVPPPAIELRGVLSYPNPVPEGEAELSATPAKQVELKYRRILLVLSVFLL